MDQPKRLLPLLISIVLMLAACSPASSTNNTTQAASPTQIQPTSMAQAGTSLPIPVTGGSLTAKLSEITGQVLAREAQDSGFVESTPGYILQALGQVQTKSDGKVRLDFPTGTLLRLGPDTLFTMQPPQANSQGLVERVQLTIGRLWIILHGGSLQVQTKSGVAAVLGSLMSVDYNSDSGGTRVTCLEGHCSLSDTVGTVNITTGQVAEVINLSLIPQVGNMTDQDYQDWQANNPESSTFVPPSSAGGNPVGPGRQAGTVGVVNPGPVIIPVTGGSASGLGMTLGSCATIEILNTTPPPPDNVYQASIVPEPLLPVVLPSRLESCGVKVLASPTSYMAADIEVCFEVLPTQAALAYYWDGSKWVQTTLKVSDGQSCVIIPSTAASPAYAGLFSLP